MASHQTLSSLSRNGCGTSHVDAHQCVKSDLLVKDSHVIVLLFWGLFCLPGHHQLVVVREGCDTSQQHSEAKDWRPNLRSRWEEEEREVFSIYIQRLNKIWEVCSWRWIHKSKQASILHTSVHCYRPPNNKNKFSKCLLGAKSQTKLPPNNPNRQQ